MDELDSNQSSSEVKSRSEDLSALWESLLAVLGWCQYFVVVLFFPLFEKESWDLAWEHRTEEASRTGCLCTSGALLLLTSPCRVLTCPS